MARCRPFSQKEAERENANIVCKIDNHTLELREPQDKNKSLRRNDPLRFNLDRFCDRTVTNYNLYTSVCKGMSSNIMQGISSTVIAFGSANTGKTHTMFGTVEDPGIVYMILDDIFSMTNGDQIVSSSITMSALEITNEVIHDLQSVNQKKVELRDDYGKDIVISGLASLALLSQLDMRIILK